MTRKTQKHLLQLIIVLAALFISLPADADDGETLFQQHCIRCHLSAQRIKTSPDKIGDTLSSGKIRTHRFTLDDKTIQQIVDYIRTPRPAT